MNGIALQLPPELDSDVKRTLADWDQGKKMERLWARDASLWTNQYTFGVVKAAQARGDFEVLAARKRRALRVHL